MVFCIAAVPAGVWANARKQKALVVLTHTRLQALTQTFDAQVKAIGVPDVFEMLGGQKDFDRSKIVETRSHMGELATLLEQTKSSAEGELRECRKGLSPTDPNSVYLDHLLQTMATTFSLKREYFTEIERLLDFLISKNEQQFGITSQGATFLAQKDADIYNTSVSRIVKYEEQLAAVVAEIRTTATPKVVSEN